MDRDGAVAKHRLWPRCRHGQYFSSGLAALVDDGIIEVIEMPVRVLRQGLAEGRLVQGRAVVARPFEGPLAFDLQDFEIGNRSLKLWDLLSERFEAW